MRKLIFLLLAIVLLGINGVFFWKNRGGETKSQGCQITCSLKQSNSSGQFVLPGGLVVFM